jgi:hypothetical protein
MKFLSRVLGEKVRCAASHSPIDLTGEAIQPLDHLHTALKQFGIGSTGEGPADENGVDPESLFAAKPGVADIGVVDHLSDGGNCGVTKAKILAQGFERAVGAAVPKAALKHIERNGVFRKVFFRSENETRFLVDETPDEPGRSGTINSGSGTGDPSAADIMPWVDSGGLGQGQERLNVRPSQKGFDPFLKRARKKVNLDNIVKART